MGVLLGWGVANLLLGLKNCRSKRPRHRAFWRMNFAWGAINALIAGFALRSLVVNQARLTDSEYQNDQIRIIVFNVLLDFIYVVVGLLVYRAGKKKASLKAQGFGAAIVLQGSFLLVLDTVLAVILRLTAN